jgi:hypothetical protein
MKLSLFTITGMVLLLSSCAQFETDHYTDLAIDTYTPSGEALGAAENRAVVDLPGRGRVARFGPYTARYIGTGA